MSHRQIVTCFTCGNRVGKHYKLEKPDKDNVSYLEKLKYCFPSVNAINSMEICLTCVKSLRTCYRFHKVFYSVQEDFKKRTDNDDRVCLKSGKVEQLACKECDFTCCKYSRLLKHLERAHDHQQKKFICSYCNRQFKQANHLREHLTSHTGERNYSCPICEKTFQRQSSQSRHIKTHERPPGHKTKRTPFLCTICGKSFPFSNGVQRHMRVHLGIKKFKCLLCDRRFTQSTHLQVHMRIHTGEKPYICDTCGDKFSLKSSMDKHKISKHNQKHDEKPECGSS